MNDNIIPMPAKNNKWKIVFGAATIVVVLAVGVYAGVKYYEANISTEKTASTKNESATNTSGNDSNAPSDDTTTDIDESKFTEFRNFYTKYRIEYPNDAKIEDLSDPKADKLENATCVKIYTDNYYILIGDASATEENPSMCFRTGVGSDWINGPQDTVVAAGMTYTPNGMHTEAASAGYYSDFFMIFPVDQRVKIEYGINVNEKYGTITKAQAKDKVHSIIASYNPAE